VSPYLLLGGAVAWAASVAGAFFYGQGIGEDRETAARARDDQVAAIATEAAASAAAHAISNLKVRHVTIKQQAETVIRDNPVYRDCVHPDGMLDTINQARGYESAGSGVLPAASAPR
jgi:uncharacterized protein (UPF0333 family)